MRPEFNQLPLVMFRNYAAQLDETGSPKRRSILRMKDYLREVGRLENVLEYGNALYESIRLIENNWRTEVLEGKTLYDPNDERAIVNYFREWTEPCQRCLNLIRLCRSRKFEVPGSEKFENYYAEAVERLEGRCPFFDDADKAGRWAARTLKSRDPIRPIQVDEEGRLFEMTGERFNMPGLEPADILEALEDMMSGRLTSKS